MNILRAPTLRQGLVGDVPFMNKSALRAEPTVPFIVFAEHEELWALLDRGSCLVEGPPGSGKSTAVWLWLLRHILQTGHRGLWFHFSKTDPVAVVSITRNDHDTLSFSSVLKDNPFEADFSSTTVDVCVVDGVTETNLAIVRNSWLVFSPISTEELRQCHMIWVSSQQVVVGQEHFEKNGMRRYTSFTWTDHQVSTYAATFDAQQQKTFTHDVVRGMPEGRLMPQQDITFLQALDIKIYFFGNSVRWLFAMKMEEALEDLSHFVEAIDDAKILKAGLTGSRSRRAVNHVIAMDRSATRERSGVFKIASTFITETLSSELGLEAIRVMYASRWVKSNPSVHGFVFEWDILTRLEGNQQLLFKDIGGNELMISVENTIRLAQFDISGMIGSRLLVCPEKWNHPEYDGLFITRDEQGLHVIAWNASEATTHSGSVAKLLVQLEFWAHRELNPIAFNSVRFLFLVPAQNLATFQMPSDVTCLAARKHLHAWNFQTFEVYGTLATPPA
mmetsp:Transcript_3351/g.8517  ORF Transcript_3351/g.8517 Transcript_3351/m.8517 type:complete len:503 (+) Transcript_3351:170-1678(+)